MSESKVVSREPTEAMMQAAYEDWNNNAGVGKSRSAGEGMRARWRAMYDAAPPAVPDAPPMQGDDAALCVQLYTPYDKHWVLREDDYTYFTELCGKAAACIEQLSAEVATSKLKHKEEAAQIVKLIHECDDQKSLVAQQKERIAELEKDAARYRWLRRYDHFAQVDAMLDTTEYNTLDSAVDAALAADREGGTK